MLRRLTIGIPTSTFVMFLLNTLSFFVRSTGSPQLDGTHAIGCPRLIWQCGGISGGTLFHFDGFVLAIACTISWGIALGVFAGDDLERMAKWLQLPFPLRRPITLKTLLSIQFATALVAGAGVTGIAQHMIYPLILLGPLVAWPISWISHLRDIPYAGLIVILAAFACIVFGAATSPTGTVPEAVAYCVVSWLAQSAIYWRVNRTLTREPECC